MAKDIAVINFNDEATLRNLKSVRDVLDTVGDIEDISDSLGTGFVVLKDKAQLVGVNFVILTWNFHEGDNGPYVSVFVITDRDEKLIINDGSTGIRDQLASLGTARPLKVRGGLTRSDYKFRDEDGKERSATTFYLAV